MSTQSSIEWTDTTWNPVRGCSIVSPGCVNCYAMKQAHRFSGEGKSYHGLTKLTKAGPQWTGVVRTVEDALLEPLSWRKPRRVFVNSMSDLFHEDVPWQFIDVVFAVMALCTRHTFQVLTKRPERMLWYLTQSVDADGRFARQRIGLEAFQLVMDHYPKRISDGGSKISGEKGREGELAEWPRRNIWLGVSAEDQQRADERIPLLLQTPAAVRFVSAEPLLGPVNLRDWTKLFRNDHVVDPTGAAYTRLDWIIVGGESGHGARRFDIAWARDIIEKCRIDGVACFIKQLGSCATNIAYPTNVSDYERERWMRDGWTRVISSEGECFTKHPRLRDRKGGDPSEWPEDLRVREFPRRRDDPL